MIIKEAEGDVREILTGQCQGGTSMRQIDLFSSKLKNDRHKDGEEDK